MPKEIGRKTFSTPSSYRQQYPSYLPPLIPIIELGMPNIGVFKGVSHATIGLSGISAGGVTVGTRPDGAENSSGRYEGGITGLNKRSRRVNGGNKRRNKRSTSSNNNKTRKLLQVPENKTKAKGILRRTKRSLLRNKQGKFQKKGG